VTERQEEVELEARQMAMGRNDLAPDWFNGRVRPMLCQRLDLTSIAQVLAVADDVWGPGMLRDDSVFVVTQGLRDRGFID
jgi:hypothetical protein